MTDERPLSSEEMIRRAREDLSGPLSVPDPTIRSREEIEEMAEAEMPSIEQLARPQPRPRRTRPHRVERKTPTGFGDTRSSGPAVAAIAMAILLLAIGIIAFVALGTATP